VRTVSGTFETNRGELVGLKRPTADEESQDWGGTGYQTTGYLKGGTKAGNQKKSAVNFPARMPKIRAGATKDHTGGFPQSILASGPVDNLVKCWVGEDHLPGVFHLELGR